jgi:hypothetical protein
MTTNTTRILGARARGLAAGAALAALAAGCAPASRPVARAAASRDLDCPIDRVRVVDAHDGPVGRRDRILSGLAYDALYRVEACGATRTYACTEATRSGGNGLGRTSVMLGTHYAGDRWKGYSLREDWIDCYERPGADGIPVELRIDAARGLDCTEPLAIAARPTPRAAVLQWAGSPVDVSAFEVRGCGRGATFACALRRDFVDAYDCAKVDEADPWLLASGPMCDGQHANACHDLCAHSPELDECRAQAARARKDVEALFARGRELALRGEPLAASAAFERACAAGVLDACRAQVRLVDDKTLPPSRATLVAGLQPLCAAHDAAACARLRALGESP